MITIIFIYFFIFFIYFIFGLEVCLDAFEALFKRSVSAKLSQRRKYLQLLAAAAGVNVACHSLAAASSLLCVVAAAAAAAVSCTSSSALSSDVTADDFIAIYTTLFTVNGRKKQVSNS